MKVLDLFAGPGGWDVGAQALGLDPLGIEWDDAAVQTRKAAGLRTVRADVAELDPEDECRRAFGVDAPLDLLIASPPCQAWSMAGKRQGQEDIERVYELSREIAKGFGTPIEWDPPFEWADPRSKLVTEPLRWALALRPSYLAWEQVPPVLDYWKFCADILRAEGYSVWTGILSAERYGVPQTRKRAILMASLDGPVEPPRPTHQAYTAGESAWDEPMTSLEGELLPWVSMAEALGWNGAIGFPRNADEGEATEDGYRERDFRDAEEPAFNLTEKARSWTLRNVAQENAAERAATDPAPTITGAHDSGERRWLRAGTNENDISRPEDEPAPTIRYSERQNDVSWTQERPSPTIVGTRRSKDGPLVGRQLPAGEGENVGGKNWTPESPAPTVMGGTNRSSTELPNGSGGDAVRVSVEEAAILQGFDPSYPWQGSRTKQFQQIGNAVPPPLAEAVLSALLA